MGVTIFLERGYDCGVGRCQRPGRAGARSKLGVWATHVWGRAYARLMADAKSGHAAVCAPACVWDIERGARAVHAGVCCACCVCCVSNMTLVKIRWKSCELVL